MSQNLTWSQEDHFVLSSHNLHHIQEWSIISICIDIMIYFSFWAPKGLFYQDVKKTVLKILKPHG